MDLHEQWPIGVGFDFDHVLGIFTSDRFEDVIRSEKDLPKAAFTYWLPNPPVLERQIRQYGAIDKLPGEGEANIQRRAAAGGRFDGHPLPLLGCFVLVSFVVRSMSLAHIIIERLRIFVVVVFFCLAGGQEERFLIFSLGRRDLLLGLH